LIGLGRSAGKSESLGAGGAASIGFGFCASGVFGSNRMAMGRPDDRKGRSTNLAAFVPVRSEKVRVETFLSTRKVH
jgi:hypothetical protein